MPKFLYGFRSNRITTYVSTAVVLSLNSCILSFADLVDKISLAVELDCCTMHTFKNKLFTACKKKKFKKYFSLIGAVFHSGDKKIIYFFLKAGLNVLPSDNKM